ncbi:S8 family serine peptidase [Nonlabens ponticola]|uniref:Peptidase S8 n=1 Tax=Nonlabens ponticola TaxID=2496866 RepID=A0A3S9MVE3_9FLAO|nr:S8 family serine peptidase [Nonlabens ponticola]AZQ43176.1 peptidase S8 [Nonlabens ponticola]
MNNPILKYGFMSIAAATILTGCGSGNNLTIVSPPIENIDQQPLKASELNEFEAQNWKDLDLGQDTIPGMSVNKAYSQILTMTKNGQQVVRKGEPVIVAVIDSGVDTEHEDLDGVLWVNEDEIPGNGIDDDKNGYIDDVHGWNFLGDIIEENLEYERIVRDADKLPADIVAKARKEYNEKLSQATEQKAFLEQQLQAVKEAQQTLQQATGKNEFTIEDVNKIEANNENLNRAKLIGQQVINNYESFENILELINNDLNETIALLNGEKLKTNYRMDILGDDPYVWDTGIYGNNEYSGPDPEKADAFHGTHVAGIIAAERDNGKGVNGVANNARIMVLRAVSQADEYDKDVAKAIRYAADNGAKVINTSFGKYHSPNPEWVWEAIEYAASKDVLIVNAAGNEGIDTDVTQVYPQDQEGAGEEISDNFLTVGALNYRYGPNVVANFSNYGGRSVDVFAPGVAVYSTAPNNKYRNAGGTSMASPAVAGVAAVLRSQFPKLTAAQTKQIIMDSGLTLPIDVVLGDDTTQAFTDITVSGKMANLYNALILASKI